jgi:hypothetical protein
MSIIIRKVGFRQDGVTNIYVGRKSSYGEGCGLDGSSYGNPFWMSDESKRNEVCDKYEECFKTKILTNPILKGGLDRLREKAKTQNYALICFCWPKRCHAETILRYLEDI